MRYRLPAREDARFRIYDPERNFGPLSVTHIRLGQSETVLDSMAQGGADAGCASLGYCAHPDSTNLDMILMRDTVTFTFHAEGFKPFGSGFCVSKYTERGRRTYKHSWQENDLLVIRIGEDTVKVLYDMAMAVRPGGQGRLEGPRILDRRAGLSAWPAGVAGTGNKAEFFGLDGAGLGAYGLGESLAALPVGLVWVRWPGMRNGEAPAKLMLR